MTSRAVVLLSGGLDSAVVLALARRDCDEVYALTVRYGQRHAIEVECARAVALDAGVHEHRILDVDLSSWGGSALTGDGLVPKDRELPDAEDEVPPTYVPARNTILLALALGWAEVLGAEAIYIGAHTQDAGGYPDTRPEYLEAFGRMSELATRAGLEGRGPRIRAPLIRKSKAEVIATGRALGVDFGKTSSCYDPLPSGSPCGRCDSCRLRERGFEEAGGVDPRKFVTGRPSIIDEVRIGTLDLSLRGTFRTHWKELRRHATLHVRVRSGANWGEGEAYTMDTEGGLGVLRTLRLEGRDARDLDSLIEPIDDTAARSALDLALHDLLGRLDGVPVHRFLGLPRATRTSCISIGIDDPESMVASATGWIERGFPIIKLKITTDTDLDLIRRIRAIGGPSLHIWVDANQAFTPDAAVEVGKRLAGIGVEIFEQPLPVGSLDAYAGIRSRIPIPIVLDEEIRSAEDVVRAAAAGGVDGINVKPAKIGGIRSSLQAIHAARACGLRIFLGCYFESSLGIAGAAALLAHADFVDLDAPLHLAEDPYRGLDFHVAEIAAPDAPGLGVERR